MKNRTPATTPNALSGTVPTRPLPDDFWEKAKVAAPELYAQHVKEQTWFEHPREAEFVARCKMKAEAFWEATRPEREREQANWQHKQVMHAHAAAYALLGLAPGATLTQIKKAYRQKARTMHPDRGGNEAAMKRLNAAYEQLIAARQGPSFPHQP